MLIPAYEAMQQDACLRDKLCGILMRGVSTRHYEAVAPEMANTCGVSRSSVSREFVAASAEQLQALCERRFDELELLIVYIDGYQDLWILKTALDQEDMPHQEMVA